MYELIRGFLQSQRQPLILSIKMFPINVPEINLGGVCGRGGWEGLAKGRPSQPLPWKG